MECIYIYVVISVMLNIKYVYYIQKLIILIINNFVNHYKYIYYK